MTSSDRRGSFVIGWPVRLSFVLVAVGACVGTERARLAPTPSFGDAGVSDAGDDPCALVRCSLDGRAVLNNCTEEVVESCPPDLACGAGQCVEPCVAAERERGSRGCDFFFQPPPAYAAQGLTGCYAAFLVNTSAVPSTVRLEYQGSELDLGGAVFTTPKGGATLTAHDGPIAPGEGVIVFVADPAYDGTREHVGCPEVARPATLENPDRIVRGTSSSFHLVTSAPVSASTIFPFGGAASQLPTATLLLPTSTWGTEHMIINPWSMGFVPRYTRFGPFPAAQIVAKEDDTTIDIFPSADIQDDGDFVGSPKQIRATYRLDRGQYLQIAQPDELTGSVVTSSKPTSVFGAHSCMFIPEDIFACDTAQQQIPPFAQWGSEYAAVGYLPRKDGGERSPYRIVAAVDGTLLTYDPAPPLGAPTTLDGGEVATVWTQDPFVVRSQDGEHPIYVGAYMTGALALSAGGEVGDPEFVNVIPAAQYLNDYAFFSDPTYPDTSLVVVREKTALGFEDVTLECAQGAVSDFVPLGNEGRFEYARIVLAKDFVPQKVGAGTCGYGIQRMQSRGPFTATLWGTAPFASYALPGGMSQRALVQRSVVVR